MERKLEEIRSQIDDLDLSLIFIMGKRLKLAQKIGKLKRAKKLPIFDERRESEILECVKKYSKSFPESIRERILFIFQEIIKNCRGIQ